MQQLYSMCALQTLLGYSLVSTGFLMFKVAFCQLFMQANMYSYMYFITVIRVIYRLLQTIKGLRRYLKITFMDRHSSSTNYW